MGIFPQNSKPNVLFVSSEEAPFAKVGGLGEVVFALPRALVRLGYDARVMIPRYGTIDPLSWNMPYTFEGLDVPTAPGGGTRLVCNVRRAIAVGDRRSPVTTYFLENQEYYEFRANVYGYADDRIRFALLSRGCLEFLNRSREWLPDVIVTTDWMTGYLPNFLKTDYRDYARLAGIATVFSIHNLSSHGTIRPYRFLGESERDDGFGPVPDFFSPRMQQVNAMRRGILYADVINTVSPTYAKEITTPEFGEGLDGLLREKSGRLSGILNGIDYETVNPASDPFLPKKFDAKTIEARIENKGALQKRFGLPENPGTFVMGVVSRLTRQKGFSLLLPVIEAFLQSAGAQLIIVGTGETDIMDFFQVLEKKFPAQVRTHLQFDEALPHMVYAGSDVVLIPSQFEPSGLTQMEAMRFGAVPVARRVGGLADTIEDFNPATGEGTGFLFDEFEPNAFMIAMTRAFVNWRHHGVWKRLQKIVMTKDFSWDRSAREYGALFDQAVLLHRQDNREQK